MDEQSVYVSCQFDYAHIIISLVGAAILGMTPVAAYFTGQMSFEAAVLMQVGLLVMTIVLASQQSFSIRNSACVTKTALSTLTMQIGWILVFVGIGGTLFSALSRYVTGQYIVGFEGIAVGLVGFIVLIVSARLRDGEWLADTREVSSDAE